MVIEPVLRKFDRVVGHDFIAGHLCNHTGGCDAERKPIAFYDGSLLYGKWMNRQPINQRMLGNGMQRGHGTPHGLLAGAEDIDPVDHLFAHDGV